MCAAYLISRFALLTYRLKCSDQPSGKKFPLVMGMLVSLMSVPVPHYQSFESFCPQKKNEFEVLFGAFCRRPSHLFLSMQPWDQFQRWRVQNWVQSKVFEKKFSSQQARKPQSNVSSRLCPPSDWLSVWTTVVEFWATRTAKKLCSWYDRHKSAVLKIVFH